MSYLCVDGLDMTGKSTQCELLAQRLLDYRYNVFKTKEPKNESLRALVKEFTYPYAVNYLFGVDALAHVYEQVIPYLQDTPNSHVVQDRSFRVCVPIYSRHEPNLGWFMHENPDFQCLPKYSLLIILDVPVPELIKRRQEREVTWEHDRAKESVLQQRRVQYLGLATSPYIETVARQTVVISGLGAVH